ncbi:hypothetical protein niasHT_020373 [Heterodera trifolii]|uniref:Glycosyl transferase family 1 domain-containing protein n=1 Tax=Heterodera trifolii TaxID=157864 RepID=A0ABD2JX60_9BILA
MKRILPLTSEKHADLIEYVGEIGPEQRNDFLGNATAFLFTPKWDEPFGLGMIEAMATGTPVIAIQRGAVGEIVIDDVNGVTFDYEDNQMIFDFINVKQLVARVSKLNRAKIRQIVEQRWSLEQMSKNYDRGVHLDNFVRLITSTIFSDLTRLNSIQSWVMFPDLLADDGPTATSSAGQVLSKWLHKPTTDGQPKRLRCLNHCLFASAGRNFEWINNFKEGGGGIGQWQMVQKSTRKGMRSVRGSATDFDDLFLRFKTAFFCGTL